MNLYEEDAWSIIGRRIRGIYEKTAPEMDLVRDQGHLVHVAFLECIFDEDDYQEQAHEEIFRVSDSLLEDSLSEEDFDNKMDHFIQEGVDVAILKRWTHEAKRCIDSMIHSGERRKTLNIEIINGTIRIKGLLSE